MAALRFMADSSSLQRLSVTLLRYRQSGTSRCRPWEEESIPSDGIRGSPTAAPGFHPGYLLTYRTKTTRRRAIPLFHTVAPWLSVALPPITPNTAFILEELLCALSAFPIVNRTALVVGTYAGA